MSRKPAKSILFLLALLIQLTISGNLAFAQDACVKVDPGSNRFDLYAGQYTMVGTVSVAVVGDQLEVTYNTINGWLLMAAHLWVGDDMEEMPQAKNGNPKVGHFPYKEDFDPVKNTHTFTIPLTYLAFSCEGESPDEDKGFFMAAYAKVINPDDQSTEGAWSKPHIWMQNGGNWITYSIITLSCDCQDGPFGVNSCETAFAYSETISTCFLDMGQEFNRWGWTIGPLGKDDYILDIYAAVGQCDMENNGTLVGTLYVNYYSDPEKYEVYYDIDELNGYTLDEAQLYIGCGKLPKDVNGNDTVAPGQYPYGSIEESTIYTYNITDFDGCTDGFHVVAHANVCGYFYE